MRCASYQVLEYEVLRILSADQLSVLLSSMKEDESFVYAAEL
jgi:hypothetical protein